ncbi:HU family DNA-binding protein [Gammaproteobacteria bacterium]|nr:HU family DNA-binding protein [Gammaproteobacteria bacterium]
MNKAKIISSIAESTGLSINSAENTLKTVINQITETLSRGETVSLTGFGNFTVKKREARKVRNPQNGQEMMTKEKMVPHFKAGKGLKESVDSVNK